MYVLCGLSVFVGFGPQPVESHLLLIVTTKMANVSQGLRIAISPTNRTMGRPLSLSAKRFSPAPELPPCEFTPKPYKGPSYEKVSRIRFTHLAPCLTTNFKKPLFITEGKMQWLFDHTGRRYLDMFGGIVTVSVGHCHPKVTAAVTEQMNTLAHTTNIYYHPKIHEYAAALTARLPGDLKVAYFVNSGTEANELAIVMAKLHTRQTDVISLRNGYHGVMGPTAMSTWRYDLPVTPSYQHAMNPDVYGGLWGGSSCRDSPVQTNRKCECTGDCQASEKYYHQLEEVFKYSLPRGRVAAFIAESIQGVGGAVQYPKGYLKKAFELVRINGGVCISDEVQTGFGRTGEHFWGFEGHGVRPDIVTMAKGMGNGFPLAAVVTTAEIAESLSQALHFNTFGGNPVASAVGLAVLDVIDSERIQKNAATVGTYLLLALAELREKFESVGDVRGKGLMIGVELVKDKASRVPMANKHFMDIWDHCKEMGLLVGRGGFNGNVLRVKPPMCVTMADADFTVAVLRRALQAHNEKVRRVG